MRRAIPAGPRTRSRSTSRQARWAWESRSRSSLRLIQDYLTAHGRLDDKDRGRFVALIGDAELDEGNIYEAIIEGAKHDVRNLWWIVDYNRQSLDATSADRMFERFDEIFRSCGWRVVELRYGKKLQAALDAHPKLKAWFEKLPNADLSALHYQGGAAWRARIDAELGKSANAFLKEHDDAALAALFTDLGGHCMETLVAAFDAAQDDVPTLFIAWTIKGYGLPFAGHKDNHSGLMNPTQMAAWREAMGVREGHEWEPLESVGDNARSGVEALLDRTRIAREKRSASLRWNRHSRICPRRPATSNRRRPRSAASCSTCRRPAVDLADSIVTTSPDVTVSTNLGAWVNQRGLFSRRRRLMSSRKAKIPSAQKWGATQQGPAHRARDRREQSVPVARRGGAFGRPVRDAPVPHRNALRPVHRARPR